MASSSPLRATIPKIDATAEREGSASMRTTERPSSAARLTARLAAMKDFPSPSRVLVTMMSGAVLKPARCASRLRRIAACFTRRTSSVVRLACVAGEKIPARAKRRRSSVISKAVR
jgi:hypothetical protein